METQRIPRIICVDDDQDLLNTVADLIELKFGVFVARAGSVRDALTIIGKNDEFDIVISDFQMPPENGDGFHRELRASGNKSLFVLYSSYDGVKTSGFHDDYFLGHIQKPESKSLVALVGKGLAQITKR